MFKRKKVSESLLLALTGCMVASSYALAEDKPKDEDIEKISIVGSNIKINRDTGALPVTTVTEDDILNSGALSGDELLAEIPQVGDVGFNEARAGAGVNDARGDVSSINLRGAGSGNTLTLLNGRRLVLHPGTQSENRVPITTVNSNTLPVKGLKRVEVLRDGAGAVYGSDAVAGVVNYVLKDDYEGSEFSIRYGEAEGTSRNDLTIGGVTGISFNDDKSNLIISANYLTREGMPASEREYAARTDLRQDPRVPDELKEDTDLDNSHLGSPWLEYQLGTTSGSSTRYHVQPATESGCIDEQPSGLSAGTCVDQGSLGRNQRYNRNQVNSLISDLDRANLYTMYTQELENDMELFAEGIYYYAKSTRDRFAPHMISSQRFTVAADAYYNPLGEMFTVRNYRAVDAGPRVTEVEDNSYRALVGVRGFFDSWDWETAALYSKAETEDTTYNWVRLDLLAQAANSKDQATAYNLFNGGDAGNLSSVVDPTPNAQSVLDSITDTIYRDAETEIALVDFKISTGELFELPMGEVGFAFGSEFRRETYSEDRDNLLNTNFVDINTGRTLGGSNALGNSPTLDSEGSRNVVSAYVEFYVPLLTDAPFAEQVDLQIAARYEDFSDINQDVLKPKVALSWVANDYFQFRASFAESFKAPGIPQVVTAGLARSNTTSDPVFGERQGTTEIRSGSDQLKPEDSTNKAAGIVLNPTDDLTFTVDWWQIEQDNAIGQLDVQTQILYDALLRSEGSSNPAVVRNSANEIVQVNNAYLNLLPRKLRGLDFGVYYDLATNIGDFDFKLTAAKMLEFSQEVDPITQAVIDAQEAGNTALQFDGQDVNVPGAGGTLLAQDGNPEWRANLTVAWKRDNWSAGVTGRYISEFVDTGVNNTRDANGDTIYLPVDSWFTANMYVNYTFDQGDLEGTKLTFGIRNIADKEPPLADETFGYDGSVHNSTGRYIYLGASYNF